MSLTVCLDLIILFVADSIRIKMEICFLEEISQTIELRIFFQKCLHMFSLIISFSYVV